MIKELLAAFNLSLLSVKLRDCSGKLFFFIIKYCFKLLRISLGTKISCIADISLLRLSIAPSAAPFSIASPNTFSIRIYSFSPQHL